MKDKNPNGIWPFTLDNVHSYAYQENLFTPQECEKIIKLGKAQKLENAKVQDRIDKTIRNNKVSWIYPSSQNNHWIFSRITGCILNLNLKFFNFDLFGFTEGFQFTNYKAPAQYYDSHTDRGLNTQVRKLSFSLLLNNPETFSGGELCIQESTKEFKIPNQKQGSLIAFPSFILHNVTPVTKGERNSLVGWITGPNFK